MVSEGAADREYDLVLFGATGFTGGLTAEYLARQVPEGCRWAVAGRNRAKLEALRERLGLPELPVLVADSADPAALAEVARAARVVVTTVGPYQRYGEPLVAACADAGTDYVDLTGEPEFVDTMYNRYHARAVASGARMVHACGFDSVPHDLGVLFTVGELGRVTGREELDGPVGVEGYVRVSGTFSGGTFASTLTAFSRPVQMSQAAKARRLLEPPPAGRKVHGLAVGPRWSKDARAWAVPMPAIDQQVILRSAAALPAYGPDFRYGHYAAVKRLPIALAGIAAVVGIAVGAQIPPLRRKLESLRPSGAGPDEAQRARSWFTVRFSATAGDHHVWTEVSGGDPGYGETAKMLAETALCLAYDDLPKTAGQQTTASACGSALIDRLRAAGITFRVLDSQPTEPPSRFGG
ncbi:saccharopine dehydrogenase [Streptacidiphilus pinicola]|uniref:Saccharopine dehydrogenase n=1 Tax=Streptacidiphilus pinicola TaxID=2219663 RepID=A0A2X0K0G4_9ACTN|nr:saccharopine dehydrogenase NADP-binding domain-containing protein [Streptacidiphilus pinicola]RAG81009.1 saccharopine dehydrogenase [Streptacidiphilus pinicola]